jgi:HEAT repeat protein
MTREIYELLQSPDEDVRLKTVLELERPLTVEDITTLVDMLSDKNWRVRKAVTLVLASLDVNIVVPLLVKFLGSGNTGIQNVRFQNAAIECLTTIGQPAIPGLTVALHDPNKDVRISAANALGAIHHRDACDALIAALQDEHVNVRYAAVEALSKIPSQQSVIPLTRILESDEEWLKLPAISALGHIGDYRATPYLIKMVQQSLYRQTAIEALGNIGDERGIPCIIEALNSIDKEIRRSAVLAMENMARKLDKFQAILQQPSTYRTFFRSACTEQIMHYLIEFTNEKDYTLVMAAIKLLGWSGSQEAAYVLLEKLGDEQLLEAVASALIQIGENAITPLAHAYETSKSLEKKLLIIDSLRELGGELALRLLLNYLKESKEELLVHALIKSLNHQAFISLLVTDKHPEPARYFEPILTSVKQYLKSPHPLIRAEAVYLWGQLIGVEAFDDILNATKDAHPAVRVNAIKHLGLFAKGDQELTQHLIIFLSDDHPQIRRQAAISLGDSENAEAFPALLLVLDDPDAMVRRAAVTGLGMYLCHHSQEQYRQQVLDRLSDVLEHRCRRYEDGLLKIEICNSLQQIISDRSKELLLQLTHDFDFDVRKSAILALGAFVPYKTALTSALLPFLQDEHWSVREAAVTTIGLLQIEEAKEKLFPLLDDPDLTVRKALLITLGRIGSIQAIPILVKNLADDNLDYAAYQALAMIATQHKDLIAPYLAEENPKIHLFIEHILGRKMRHNINRTDMLR